MRRLNLTAAIAGVLLSASTLAWGGDELATGSGRVITGGAGGPVVQRQFFEDDSVTLAGGHGGLLIRDTLMIGGGGYIGLPSQSEEQRKLGYGGLRLELFLFRGRQVNASASLLSGVGGMDYETESGEKQSASFAAFEPSLNLNVRVTSFLTLSPGVRYLHAFPFSGGDSAPLPEGFAAALSLRFGRLGS